MSLRARVTLAAIVVLAVALAAVGAFVYLALRSGLDAELRTRLQDRAALAQRLAPTVPDTQELADRLSTDDTLAAVATRRGLVRGTPSPPGRWGWRGGPRGGGPPRLAARALAALRADTTITTDPDAMRLRTTLAGGDTLLLSASRRDQEQALSRLVGLSLGGSLLALPRRADCCGSRSAGRSDRSTACGGSRSASPAAGPAIACGRPARRRSSTGSASPSTRCSTRRTPRSAARGTPSRACAGSSRMPRTSCAARSPACRPRGRRCCATVPTATSASVSRSTSCASRAVPGGSWRTCWRRPAPTRRGSTCGRSSRRSWPRSRCGACGSAGRTSTWRCRRTARRSWRGIPIGSSSCSPGCWTTPHGQPQDVSA